jgi:hypothetical protein
MVSSMDGYSAGTGSLLRNLSSEIAMQGPAAVYDTGSFESQARTAAYRGDTRKNSAANAPTVEQLAENKPVGKSVAPEIPAAVVAAAGTTIAPPFEILPTIQRENIIKSATGKTLAELVPPLRRVSYVSDETGPLSASRLDPATAVRSGLKVDALALQTAMSFQPPRIELSDAKTVASDTVSRQADRSIAVANAAECSRRPEYAQFANKDLACSISHSFNLDGTAVKQTAMEGAHRFWSLEKVGRNDGSTCETLTCPMGKERWRKDTAGDNWSITETNYESNFGRESLWRSRVSVYSSKGTETINHYSGGKQIASENRSMDQNRA